MREICTWEVGWMKKVLKDLNITCKITYTLLNKKTNLKVFANNCGKIDNAPPGTIVDSGLTSNELNDFYLIPAKSNQGLASSTHYQIVYDDAQIKAHEFHTLIYKLCYLYYNWTGSIKVPAPCQYAKKLVTLLGEKLSDRNNTFIPNSQSPNLFKNLYYL
jgi:aubergine-like protein